MGTDVTGMVINYPVNRPLTDYEQANSLNIKKSQGKAPRDELSLIKLNSAFAESVDKFYEIRGLYSMFAGVVAGLTWYVFFTDGYNRPWDLMLMNLVLSSVTTYVFLQDAFTYTHYPIRFNRQNRMVYVLQRNVLSRKATVLKASWDSLYFTISKTAENNSRNTSKYIAGHVLEDDGITVTATFALSMTVGGNESNEALKNHFEFYRLYMEEGPEATIQALAKQNTPFYCLPPIDKKRESWSFGWTRLNAMFNGLMLFKLVMQVILFPASFFRWIVMHTSKIPQWPDWVEQECAIEANDPWLRDHSTNKIDVYGRPV